MKKRVFCMTLCICLGIAALLAGLGATTIPGEAAAGPQCDQHEAEIGEISDLAPPFARRVEAVQDGERVVQDAVLPRPVNIHHGPDTAGVAFPPLKFQSVLSHLTYPLYSLYA